MHDNKDSAMKYSTLQLCPRRNPNLLGQAVAGPHNGVRQLHQKLCSTLRDGHSPKKTKRKT